MKIDDYVGGKVNWVAHHPDNSTSSGTLEDLPGGTKVHLIPRTAFDNYFGTWSIDYTCNDIKNTADVGQMDSYQTRNLLAQFNT